jgi:hypothetical protein
VDLVALLGRAVALALAAGVNVYATVALIGLAVRFEWVALPAEYQVFGSNLVIGAAVVLYVVEFVADKVPWVDSLWDAVHTAIRPIGGAFIAVATLGEASPVATVVAALVGGAVATSSHLTKAGTRAMVNTSPEPFSNWALSLTEDAFVLGLGYLALQYPVAALVVSLAVLLGILTFSVVLLRAAGRWLGRRRQRAPALH